MRGRWRRWLGRGLAILVIGAIGAGLFLWLDRPGPPLRPGVGPLDLAPPDTVFFSDTPSIVKVYQRWLQGHNAAFAHPATRRAATFFGDTVLRSSGVRLGLPPDLGTVVEGLSVAAPDEVFLAFVAPVRPGEPLDCVMGGHTLGADATALALRQWLSARTGAVWTTRRVGAFTVFENGRLCMIAWDRWLLLATRPDLLEGVMQRGAGEAPALGASPLMQRMLRHAPLTDAACLFGVYTDVGRLTDLLMHDPRAPFRTLGERLSRCTPWLEGVAWTYGVDVDTNVSSDLVFYALSARAAGPLAAMPSLDGRTRAFVRGATTVHLPLALSRSVLRLAPDTPAARAALSWMDRLGTPDTVEVAFVMDTPPDGPPRWCWVVPVDAAPAALPAELSAPQVGTLRVGAARGFVVMAPDDASVRWFCSDAREGPGGPQRFPSVQGGDDGARAPFLALDYDSNAIVRRAQMAVQAQWPHLRQRLVERGMDLAEQPPQGDLSVYFQGAHLEVRVVDDGVRVDHAIRKGPSSSTGLSPFTCLVTQACWPELEARWRRFYDVCRVSGGDGTNLTAFVTGDLLATWVLFLPTLSEGNGPSVLSAVTAFVWVAGLDRIVP